MPLVPRRYGHFVFGALQSGLTCAIASAIASAPVFPLAPFLRHWLSVWLMSWLVMLPMVLLAAPGIRRLSDRLTRER